MNISKIKISPLLAVSSISFVAALIIWLYPSSSDKALSQETSQVQGVTQEQALLEVSPSPTIQLSTKKATTGTSPSPQTKQTNTQQNAQNSNPTSTQTPTSSNQTTQQTPPPTTNSNSTTFEVFLKVNGTSVGNVNLPQGSNQCDVLNKALEQGKITSLNMKYDSNYGSYAVYQINKIGNLSSVWWVYKVNGQSPSKGCSYISANSADNIEWEYVGS